MAAQVTSGYSTEGNQYAKDNAYYLLDTLPGAGDVILAPVTIAGPVGSPGLIVQGTTTLQGAAAALSLNTNTITSGPAPAVHSASGPLTVTSTALTTVSGATTNVSSTGAMNVSASAGPVTVSANGNNALSLFSPAGNVAISAAGAVNAVSTAGPVSLSGATGATVAAGAGNLVMTGNLIGLTSATNITLQTAAANGVITLQNNTGGGLVVNGPGQASATGFDVRITGELNVERGFASATGNGSFAAPAVVSPAGGGGYIIDMFGQKGFFQTSGAAGVVIIVRFPIFPLITQNWVPVIGQIGVTGTNIASFYSDGVSCVIQPSNPLSPCTFSIVLL